MNIINLNGSPFDWLRVNGLMDLLEKIGRIETDLNQELPQIKNAEELKLVRSKFIGKSGVVTELLKMLGTLSSEARPAAGKQINDLKNKLLSKLDDCEKNLLTQNIAKSLSEKVDITLPGRLQVSPGKLHPVTQIRKKIEEIFIGLGFSIFEGPEIETDYYNFEALNVPKDHPARDMQDTFYINDQCPNPNDQKQTEELLLRTHTSPVQIHVMEKFKPPIRMIFPGAVYRKDADITHSPMFHQVEGLMVGDDIKMSDLKGVLTEFIHQMFGEDVGVRFRPSFFPFTEPSAEVDIRCVMCKGSGCRVCKGTGWMEILGSGMVDPNVFKAVGLDPKKVSGFAFGMGVERIAMLKFGISDIRLFFENDVRFLEQF